MKRKVIVFLLILAMTSLILPMSAFAATAKSKVVLNCTVRDFKADGVLFEGPIVSGAGLVEQTLGSDHKPVYALDKWKKLYDQNITMEKLIPFFNTTDDINQATKKTITMNADSSGYYIINSAVDEMGSRSDGFFPIDNQLFGNEGNRHNYHFSVELHATFQYKKGDTFDFKGDDDVWVFFNNNLCVDLGGVHSVKSASVKIDDLVAKGKLNIKPGDYVSFDMFYMERHRSESNMYVKTNIDFVNFNNSEWATVELFDAYKNNLIPGMLMDSDMELPVYRDEFAAIAVKLYEALSGKTAPASAQNPFTDTENPEVLKAYSLSIINGTSATTFSPRSKLNRQEAATMLTRVFKKATIEGWTLATDSKYALTSKVPKFADDKDIDDWAKESVYFMVENGIIKGLGNNLFAPKNTTDEQEASNYANASREQALVISTRSLKNLLHK